MAKYTVLMSCGHEQVVELYGKDSERKRKIAYFESQGLCKDCYRKQRQEGEKAEGLKFCASVLPCINESDGSIMISVWFDGDTFPYKDEIKSIGGYRWCERESADDFYSYHVPLCWNKEVKLNDLPDEIRKATSIGAKDMVMDSGLFATAHFKLALEMQEKWKKRHNKIEQLRKPDIPEILRRHKWNQKIYGKTSNYSIYLDGEKVIITDEQEKEIKRYLEEKEAYNRKIEEIKNEDE